MFDRAVRHLYTCNTPPLDSNQPHYLLQYCLFWLKLRYTTRKMPYRKIEFTLQLSPKSMQTSEPFVFELPKIRCYNLEIRALCLRLGPQLFGMTHTRPNYGYVASPITTACLTTVVVTSRDSESQCAKSTCLRLASKVTLR